MEVSMFLLRIPIMRTDQSRVKEERVLDHRILAAHRIQLENHSLSRSQEAEKCPRSPGPASSEAGKHRTSVPSSNAEVKKALHDGGVTQRKEPGSPNDYLEQSPPQPTLSHNMSGK